MECLRLLAEPDDEGAELDWLAAGWRPLLQPRSVRATVRQ